MPTEAVRVSFSPILGAPSESTWSQAFHKRSETSECFFVLSTSAKSAREKGRTVIEQVNQSPYAMPEALDAALKKICSLLSPAEYSLGALCLFGNMVYVWSYGNSIVLAKREGKVGKIAESSQLRVVCGPARQNDLYILGTQDFFKLYQNPFEGKNGDVEVIASSIAAEIQESPLSAGIAAYALMLNVPEQEDVAVVQPETQASETQQQIGGKLEVGSGKLAAKLLGMVRDAIQSRRIVIRSSEKGQLRKKAAMGAAVVIVIAAALLFFRQRGIRQRMRVEALVAPYARRIDEAKAVFEIDKNAARSAVQQVIADAKKKADEYSEKSFERKTFDQFVQSAEEYYAGISGERTADNLTVFYDFRLMKSDFIGKQMVSDGETAYFYDPEGKSVISLETDTKQAKIVSLSSLEDGRDIAVMNHNVFVLTGNGVYSITSLGSGETQKVIEKPDTWQQPQLLGAFGSNLYVLDRDAKQLFKYSAETNTTFAEGTSWLKSTQGFDFSNILSLAIDGKVWMSSGDGSVGVFVQGSRELFTIKGLEQPMADAFFLYVSEDAQSAYFLEPSSQRLISTDKNGELQNVIHSKQFAGATGIVISEPNGKAYIGVGSVVYEVGL